MRRDQGVIPLPKSPASPPCHKDRLFEEMKKYTRSPRATQLVPVYREFRLGHGDPLMAAAMKHWNDMALPHHKHQKSKQVLKEIPRLSLTESDTEEDKDDIHLIQHGSPLGGLGMNDIVHIGKEDVVDFPCLHFDQ